jgi:hypothetical protein
MKKGDLSDPVLVTSNVRGISFMRFLDDFEPVNLYSHPVTHWPIRTANLLERLFVAEFSLVSRPFRTHSARR